jgi:hypothetical protein
MKKRIALLIVIGILAGLLLVMAVPVLACGGDCPPPTPPPPPPGDCTPGFWKQPHHFQYWVGYEPGDPYEGGPMTLLDALQGGKATRESRFIVAGWLNAANPTAPCD